MLYKTVPSRLFTNIGANCQTSLTFLSTLPPTIDRAYKPQNIEPIIRQMWQNYYFNNNSTYYETNTIINDKCGNLAESCDQNVSKEQKTKTDAPYILCFPPVNITGNLHLGHALTAYIQDTIVRIRLMQGFKVHWVPGFDHAGIATEVKVEQYLNQTSKFTLRNDSSDDASPHKSSSHSLQSSDANSPPNAFLHDVIDDKNNVANNRLSLGRNRFIQHCEAWKERKCAEISNQLSQLGLFLDWPKKSNVVTTSTMIHSKHNNNVYAGSDYPYTLDANFKQTVIQAFNRLNNEPNDEKRLIYRANRFVNWSPFLQTAVSDLETTRIKVDASPTYFNIPIMTQSGKELSNNDDHSISKSYKVEKSSIPFGYMWEIRYPLYHHKHYQVNNPMSEYNNLKLKNNPVTFLSVHTTRPETLPNDMALAINPYDERYSVSEFQNAFVIHPLSAYYNKLILLPIIFDDRVDPAKGSGVVKISPDHDPLDYEIYQSFLNSKHYQNLKANGFLKDTHQNINSTGCGIMNNDGTIKDGNFGAGLHRFHAREKIIEYLYGVEGGKYWQGFYNYPTTVLLCQRSGDVLETLQKPQWYLSCSGSMSQRLISKLKDEYNSRRFASYPQDSKLYSLDNLIDWLDNAQDWCLSRQIWWGHQIPAFAIKDEMIVNLLKQYLKNCSSPHPYIKALHLSNDTDKTQSSYIIANDMKDAQYKLQTLLLKIRDLNPTQSSQSILLEQDCDVFDTWFSSALYPLALAQPFGGDSLQTGVKTKQNFYKYPYPLSLMETGFDIRYLWVARMLLLGHQLADQLPFNEILFHGIVNDGQGRKMSKSLGNVIDPLDVIHGATLNDLKYKLINEVVTDDREKILGIKNQKKLFPNGIPACGSDALRFALLHNNCKAQTIKVNVDRMDEYRRFGNKIWQAYRYFIMQCDKIVLPSTFKMKNNQDAARNFEDKWILSKLYHLINVCNHVLPISPSSKPKNTENATPNEKIEKYDFHLACNALHDFWLKHFCDVYIESTKHLFQSNQESGTHLQLSCLQTLALCFNFGLRLLYPYMPHLSEALWIYYNSLCNKHAFLNNNLMSEKIDDIQTTNSRNFSANLLSTMPFPTINEFASNALMSNVNNRVLLQEQMNTILDMVNKIRSFKLANREKCDIKNISLLITTNCEDSSKETSSLLMENETLRIIKALAQINKVEFVQNHSSLNNDNNIIFNYLPIKYGNYVLAIKN